jgi:HPt (histidine-containing phosphotransfer) domain-containing protein
MPVMDGLEATRAIRQLPDSHKASIPVIALTAGVLEGESIRYTEAGMQAYVGKPFREQQLLEAIVKILSPGKPESLPATISTADTDISAPDKLYDSRQLISTGKGKQAFVQKMVSLFLQTMPADLKRLNKAVTDADWDNAGRLAHKMKSAIDGMGIYSLKTLIRTIEERTKKQKELDLIEENCNLLTEVLEKVFSLIPNLSLFPKKGKPYHCAIYESIDYQPFISRRELASDWHYYYPKIILWKSFTLYPDPLPQITPWQ